MKKQSKPLLELSRERIAEILELEAGRLPTADRDHIACLKDAAKIMRKLARQKPRQPKEDFNQAAFRAIQETIRISES
jgi:hypothetical protein